MRPPEPGVDTEGYEEERELFGWNDTTEPVYRWKWYGWRNLILDGIALVTVVAGVAFESAEVSAVGLGIYVVGSPTVHAVMGNWGRAGMSLGVRTGAPATLGLIGGLALDDGSSSDFIPGWAVGAAIGLLVGANVAAGLDVGLLARERVRADAGPAVSPMIQMAPGGPKLFGLAVRY